MSRIGRFSIFIVVFSLLFSGCSRSKLERQVIQLQSLPIDLCLDSMYRYNFLQISDSIATVVDAVSSSKVLSMVVYSDETVCSSCAVKGMYIWNDLIDTTECKYGNQLPFYFIFTPEKEQIVDLKIALKRSGFNYPVYIDTLGVFKRRNNHIPDNKLLHTFLLDGNRNVVLVGSPLYNNAIMQMFYQIADTCLIR